MLHVIFMLTISMTDETTTSSNGEISAETFYKEEPTSKVILKRWKFIIDMFIENGFI